MTQRTFTANDLNVFAQIEHELAPQGFVLDSHNADLVRQYFVEWNPGLAITVSSVKEGINLMREKGVDVHWKSQAQLNFEAASKGLSAQQLAVLTSGLSRCRLITEGDQGFANKAAMLTYLQGRNFDHDTIYRGMGVLQHQGTKLYFKPTPRQSQPQFGHNAHHAPSAKDLSPSLGSVGGRINHADNPKFNGAAERLEREEAERRAGINNQTIPQSFYRLQNEIAKLVDTGRTHSEKSGIQNAANKTVGDWQQKFDAAKRVADQIRHNRERGR